MSRIIPVQCSGQVERGAKTLALPVDLRQSAPGLVAPER